MFCYKSEFLAKSSEFLTSILLALKIHCQPLMILEAVFEERD